MSTLQDVKDYQHKMFQSSSSCSLVTVVSFLLYSCWQHAKRNHCLLQVQVSVKIDQTITVKM